MMRLLSPALVGLLAACAAEPVSPPSQARIPAAPELLMAQTGQPARDLLERLAAGCWLDGVVRGAAMVVDKSNGRIIIVSDTQDLLIAEFAGVVGDQSRIRLSGPVADNSIKLAQLAVTLEAAERTGETTCPVATG